MNILFLLFLYPLYPVLTNMPHKFISKATAMLKLFSWGRAQVAKPPPFPSPLRTWGRRGGAISCQDRGAPCAPLDVLLRPSVRAARPWARRRPPPPDSNPQLQRSQGGKGSGRRRRSTLLPAPRPSALPGGTRMFQVAGVRPRRRWLTAFKKEKNLSQFCGSAPQSWQYEMWFLLKEFTAFPYKTTSLVPNSMDCNHRPTSPKCITVR